MRSIKKDTQPMSEGSNFTDFLFSDNEEPKGLKLNPKFEALKKPETIINHVQELQKGVQEQRETKGLFLIKSGNEWLDEAKLSPTPKRLFGDLWFENELCILFADTNLGKSILAVQIGDSISRGKSIDVFRLQSDKQPVLYFDFELSSKQFEVRYSVDVGNSTLIEHYDFDENFMRVELNSDADYPPNISYEDYLNQEFESAIIKSGARVIIIDNITFLKNDTEKAKDAIPLIKNLKELKKKYDLSILILAHTPKRDLSKPLSRNDLGGSKQLMNFADSSFAIGENSNEKGIRYIKQIKARNTEMKYDTNNVITCEIKKPSNFLKLQFKGYDAEHTHLKKATRIDWDEQKPKVLKLKEQGFSNVKIGEGLGVSESLIRKMLKRWEAE